MKVTILGTGCIWTKRATASYLIDDDIIVDPGSGTLKQLLKTTNKLLHHEKIEKIKLILLTHYHADHYFDIAYLMWKLANEKNPNSCATVLCPPGGEEKIKTLCKLAMSETTYNKLNFEKFIKFVDVTKMKSFKYRDLEISALKMEHGATPCYGYVIRKKNGKTISFTGDTSYCENMQYMIDNSDVSFVDMAGTDISNKHFNIIDGIELMKKYKGKCNIVPCHLTSQAHDYCRGRIAPPEDLMVLDIDSKLPYNYELDKEEKEKLKIKRTTVLETKKFKKLSGEIVDLMLALTKRTSKNYKEPTYCFDIVLHDTKTKIGTLTYSVLPNDVDGHIDNVSFELTKDYDMKSIKYECCQLIKKVALFHSSKVLYLTCAPTDFKTRKVFESLGAYLREITTYTYEDEDKTRKTLEKCIWGWEII